MYDQRGPSDGYNYSPGGPQVSESVFPNAPFIITAILAVVFLFLYLASVKFPKLMPHRSKFKWMSLISLGLTVVFASLSYFSVQKTKIEPVAAPTNVEERIQGFWESGYAPIDQIMEKDIGKMKEVGINTIAIVPQMQSKVSGRVVEGQTTEQGVKRTINMAHENGMRVFLDIAPTFEGFEFSPVNPVTYLKNVQKVIIKYAKIAEEFGVEYFSPLNGSSVKIEGKQMDEFMKDILPEVKKHYSGKVVYKKQPSTSFSSEGSKLIEEDHTTEIEFMITGEHFGVGMRVDKDSRINLSVHGGRVTMRKYFQNEETRVYKEHIDVGRNVWRSIRIEQRQEKIAVYLDNELLTEYVGDRKVHGTYNLKSGGVRIRKFTLTDLNGKSLISEGSIGDNWTGEEGWTFVDGELVGEVAANPDKSAGELTLIDSVDFAGYDMIAIVLFKESASGTLSQYRKEVRDQIKKTRQQADSDNVAEILIGEFGGTTLERDYYMDLSGESGDHGPMTGRELAAIVQMVLEEAEETTSGYFYNGWDTEGQGINQVPEVERVIKAWYNNH
jgi:hypothetical protein